MENTRPWLAKVVTCLSVLSESDPKSISEVKQSTGINRNVVAAVLNACANFGLVDVSFDGRSERFTLTFTAVMYLRILKAEFQPIVECIQEILADAKRYTPKSEADPESHFYEIIREESNTTLPAYFKLQTIADAFTLAGRRYARGSIENQVFKEFASLIKEGAGVFSALKAERDVGTSLLKRVTHSIKALQESRIVAKKQGLDGMSVHLRKIGIDEGGEAIYRMK